MKIFVFLASASVALAGSPELPDGDYTAPAKVEVATFLGSVGAEYLAGGAFLPDGRIMLAGVSQDPEVVLLGVKAKVIGKDAPAYPVQKTWNPIGSVDTGKISQPRLGSIDSGPGGGLDLGEFGDLTELKTDAEIAADAMKKKEEARLIRSIPRHLKWSRIDDDDIETAEMFRKMTWIDRESTGFWGIFSPNLKSVNALYRLPHGAGSISSVSISRDGSVYIAGGADERIKTVSTDIRNVPAVTDGLKAPESYMKPMIYLARLSPDLSRIEWVRTATSEQSGPKLRVLHDGDIMMTSPDIRRFSPDGDLKLGCPITRSRYPDSTSINPVDGSWCKGGDFLTKTGREPWRTPYFFIMRPDGTQYLELWRWRGPMAAIDALGHIVADAQVFKTQYDESGNLIVVSKSHGGNCVQIRYPYDIERMMPNPLGGLPQNTPGCIVKMDRDFQVVGSGVWGDPAVIETCSYGIDGSVALTLRASHARLVDPLCDLNNGRFVTVISPDVSTRRFASVMPGCGRRLIISAGGKCEDWGVATGWSGGRPKLLFLSGAVAFEDVNGRAYAPPQVNPVQDGYAGGRLDGYALLLDLSPGPSRETVPEPVIPSVEKKVTRRDPPILPGEGQLFRTGHENYATVHMSLREAPEGKLWPRFYYGKSDAGSTFTFCQHGDCDVRLTLRLDNLEQCDYSQDKRVLGDRLLMPRVPDPHRPGKTTREIRPQIHFEISRMRAWELVETRDEKADRILVSHRATTRVDGTLHFGEQAIPIVDAACTGSFRIPRKVDADQEGVRPNFAILDFRFEVTGGQLGFRDPALVHQRYKIRFSCTANSSVNYGNDEEFTAPSVDDMKLGGGDGLRGLDL